MIVLELFSIIQEQYVEGDLLIGYLMLDESLPSCTFGYLMEIPKVQNHDFP